MSGPYLVVEAELADAQATIAERDRQIASLQSYVARTCARIAELEAKGAGQEPVAWQFKQKGAIRWKDTNKDNYEIYKAYSDRYEVRMLYTAPAAKPGLVEAAEWCDEAAKRHDSVADEEPEDERPVLTEGDCHRSIAETLKEVSALLRARAEQGGRDA